MATSPQTLERNLFAEALAFEGTIDSILRTQKIYKGETVFVMVPKQMTGKHFPIIKEKYIAAGWNDVVWKSDQRDGDYLEFKY